MPEEEDRDQKDYEALLVIFEKFFDTVDPELSREEIFEELADARFQILLNRAVDGFGMDWEDALSLIANYDGHLSPEDEARRRILLAAFDNLADFAVAEEYHMLEEVSELEEEDRELLMPIFSKYNKRYAAVENNDVNYAMAVAAALVFMDANTSLMYMTVGDERVRPWHLQFEGFTAPKHSFPAWLIPPIEHQCRCYLVETLEEIRSEIKDAQSSIATIAPEMPIWFNRTFKESVAFGGRIFSDEHPYFDVSEDDLEMLTKIATNIKQKYLNG